MQRAVLIEKPRYPRFIILAVMLATVMEILDTTIVSVSLPHMMGSLSADRDQISWVLTSYIVAAGVLMPLTGFLVNRLGCKRLLLINIVGFMLASAFCGFSASLPQMVVFRLLQGVFGASLIPLSQFILRDTFSREEQPKVMAIWAIGVMAAPIMGPTLGGYITDYMNWRWIFYINIPICMVDVVLVFLFIKQSPLKKDVIDWVGMLLMIVSIGSLQLFLDRGEVDDWFASSTICGLFLTFLISFILFLSHCLTTKNSIINLRLFLNRNFAVGTLIMAGYAIAILGSLTLLPQMLETLYGYTSNLTGLAMAPRGIASALAMLLCSRLLSKGADARWMMAAGILISGICTWRLSNLTLTADLNYVLLIGFIQGFGIGFFFMPLSTMVYTTLERGDIAEASGLFNFGRSIGNAIGISLFITYLDRDTQTNWNSLSRHLKPTNPNVMRWLDAHHLSIQDPKVISHFIYELTTQSNFIAYMHMFRLSASLLSIILCLLLLMKVSRSQAHVVDAAH